MTEWPLSRLVTRAYDASGYNHELYTSAQAANNRDSLGGIAKFAVPTVTNGHVYVGTATALVGYGPLNQSTLSAVTNSAAVATEFVITPTGTALITTLKNAVLTIVIDYSDDSQAAVTARRAGPDVHHLLQNPLHS